jgi:hypothetical protein
MKYEIINPSDPYTIEHSDFLALAAACVLLGNGQYGLQPIGHDGERVPIFIFGGFEAWWAAHSPEADIDDYIEKNTQAIAEAMESVSLTSGRRSSLNDIGGRAKKWAAHLRSGISEGPSAPQQVFASS